MQKFLNPKKERFDSQRRYHWLFLAVGIGGAVFTSKYLGDWAFEVFQDLPRTLSNPARPPISLLPRKPQSTKPVSRNAVVIAVIDTGIDLEHPAFAGKIWTNPGETGIDANGNDKATNHIDDDKNGFVDDLHGWNFAANNNDITDRHGHGTHISGIISARSMIQESLNKQIRPLEIMTLKYYDPRTPGISNLRSSLRALKYAVQMNVNVINYSGGGLDPSPEEERVLQEARKKGILVIAAAGNERSDCDQRPFYPASYKLENILSVTAINQDHMILPTSNYGLRSVDLAAPGYNILSAKPGGSSGTMTGTSQATAYVSGIAVALLQKGVHSPLAVRRHLIMTAKLSSRLHEKVKSGAWAHYERALAMRDRNFAVNDLQTINSDIDIRFFAPLPATTFLTGKP